MLFLFFAQLKNQMLHVYGVFEVDATHSCNTGVFLPYVFYISIIQATHVTSRKGLWSTDATQN